MCTKAIRLFYSNLAIPHVSEGTEPILRSNLLRTPIKFSHSTLCDTLDLPNEGGLVYLLANDKLPVYGKSEPNVYSLITFNGEKPTEPPVSKPDIASKCLLRMLFLG